MSDSQNVPVFVRHVDDAEPRFLARLPLDSLAPLVASFADQGCFYGEDNTTAVSTQWICYDSREQGHTTWKVGYELILGLED